MGIFDELREKYDFEIPSAYRSMFEAGWFDVRGDYLWIHEAEWFTPQEILSHEPADYHKPGFVPFAFTGAGDEWCWWRHSGEDLVVLCPHDWPECEYDAPSFLGSIYRRTLEYALNGFVAEEEQQAREQLHEWATRLQPYFPMSWLETLSHLSQAPYVRWRKNRDWGAGFCTFDEHDAIIQRDLSFPRLGQTFAWMYR
jgi:hypothetical protein